MRQIGGEKPKMKTKTIVCMLLVVISLGVLFGTAAAYDADTPWTGTVKWTIPSDTTFTVTLAGSEGGINFTHTAQTETLLEPSSQVAASSTPIINISNTGNVAQNFNISVPEGVPSWAVFRVGNTSANASSTIVNKTGHIVGTSVAAGTFQDVYCWSNVTSAPGGTFSKTAYINSST